MDMAGVQRLAYARIVTVCHNCRLFTCMGWIFVRCRLWMVLVFCYGFSLFAFLGRPGYTVLSTLYWNNAIAQKSMADKETKKQ